MSIYSELKGRLDPPQGRSLPVSGRVVFSNLSHGSAMSEGFAGASLKYVARGTEYYRFRDRTFAVGEGQFMYVPAGWESEIEIRRANSSSTIGLCVFIPSQSTPLPVDEAEIVEAPLTFPASCSVLGDLLSTHAPKFLCPRLERQAMASSMLKAVTANLEVLLEDTARNLECLSAQKAATRYENLRKLNLARGYLHDVMDRPVELDELSRFAGLSRFQLLRNFRDCFGAPPATYHRRLRLGAAARAVHSDTMTCSQAAHAFGFADSSSFSHAFRRTFGHAPVRNLGPVRCAGASPDRR